MGKQVHGIYMILGLLVLTLIAVFFVYKLDSTQVYLANVNNFSIKNVEKFCIDGTSSGQCSLVRPFYCNNKGNLIEDCKSCGCNNNFYCVNSTCVSCKEKWTCSEWLSCVNKKQKRTCFDLNNCGTKVNEPLEEQSC